MQQTRCRTNLHNLHLKSNGSSKLSTTKFYLILNDRYKCSYLTEFVTAYYVFIAVNPVTGDLIRAYVSIPSKGNSMLCLSCKKPQQRATGPYFQTQFWSDS